MRDDAPMLLRPSRGGRAPLATAVALLLATGCGDGGDDSSACGPITREALDSAYLVHVVGSGTDVEYGSDPPTSGPHQAGPTVEGVVDDAIPRPVQVGILEGGSVLLQHDPELPAGDLADLEALGGPGVVVAPNPDLPAPVVATAWTYKRTCDAVDVAALQEFVEQRSGKGPDG
jgi:hypothetical protein